MRRRKADLTRRVNGELQVEFAASGLTSYAGLELLIRYFRAIGLNQLIRRHLSGHDLASDFGLVSMLRLLLALVIVGGRRVHHVAFLKSDPLIHRFCGLTDLPAARTAGRWLRRFSEKSVRALRDLNAAVVAMIIRKMPLRILTIDVDGTVISTGLTVQRAFRGYNPHRRKVPSYYPISACIAETGHILRVKNRSGNVHDGVASIGFLRDLLTQVNDTLGSAYRLNFRMDGAFFTRGVLSLLEGKGAGYAIKAPFWKWLNLKGLIADRQRWWRVGAGIGAFEKTVHVEPWDMKIRIVIYRKRVRHKTPKNYQLDLFDPNDGHFEYSAIATNLGFDRRRLWNFMCGRGAHEKMIGELKSGLAFDSVPSHRYGANSAWQQIVVLAHNLLANFQIETGAAGRPRSQKRTALHVLKSVRTLRFEMIQRAGEIVRPHGTTILRLQRNTPAHLLFATIADKLRPAA